MKKTFEKITKKVLTVKYKPGIVILVLEMRTNEQQNF